MAGSHEVQEVQSQAKARDRRASGLLARVGGPYSGSHRGLAAVGINRSPSTARKSLALGKGSISQGLGQRQRRSRSRPQVEAFRDRGQLRRNECGIETPAGARAGMGF